MIADVTYKAVRVVPFPCGVPATTVRAVLATEPPVFTMNVCYISIEMFYLSDRIEDVDSGAGLVYLPYCDERLAAVGESGAAAEGSSYPP